MPGVLSLLPVLSGLVWGLAALTSAAVALWLAGRREAPSRMKGALGLAVLATGAWALAGATAGPNCLITAMAETLRNLAWLAALYGLFRLDGRLSLVHPVRPVIVALAFVTLIYASAITLVAPAPLDMQSSVVAVQTLELLRLLFAVGGLVLVHNLHAGASPAVRSVVRWPAIAMLLLWGFDLNFFAITAVTGEAPALLAALRGLVAVPAVLVIANGLRRGGEALAFRPSRAVTFQSASLVLIGAYLVITVGVVQSLASWGHDYGIMPQLALVLALVIGGTAALTSERVRGWLRVTIAKHLFQHRYDYRAEWLRFTQTIAQGKDASASLQERVIRAVADITDSPAGLLLTEAEGGNYVLAARWQWPTADVPAEGLGPRSAQLFRQRRYVADLDDLRANAARDQGAVPVLPDWILAEPRAWAIVPLLHFDHLIGLVILARPPLARRLDWEDFDLLRVAGQQLASYLAEHAGQAALADASRFEEFNRRIAFVMHDIKNLASQLSLLARNAELHADNPEFRADMLVTLRSSTDKLNALIARLSRYGGNTPDTIAPTSPREVADAALAPFVDRHPVDLVVADQFQIMARAGALEQVLIHLIQNAVDATQDHSPVCVRLGVNGSQGEIEVLDTGCGMSADFVRTRLFRPFESSKAGGFGIGAYEARELVRAMGGKLDVESREGLGSRFVISLPLAVERGRLLGPGDSGRKVA